MTPDQIRAEATAPPVSADPQVVQGSDPELDALREILLWRYRQQVAEMQAELNRVQRQIDDKQALLAVITPILGDAIRTKVRDGREEMVEALYPIIGRLVMRAVSEAMRDLARTIDSRLRRTLTPQTVLRRWRAQISGVSGAELTMRDALPFNVEEVLLIHRDSGLLLCHVGHDGKESPDADLVSSMLTAIRDFTQQAFGRGEEGSLEEIQYGERRILIEAGLLTYLAVVVDGVEPSGYRAGMRDHVLQIEQTNRPILAPYNGDAAPLAEVKSTLKVLLDKTS